MRWVAPFDAQSSGATMWWPVVSNISPWRRGVTVGDSDDERLQRRHERQQLVSGSPASEQGDPCSVLTEPGDLAVELACEAGNLGVMLGVDGQSAGMEQRRVGEERSLRCGDPVQAAAI